MKPLAAWITAALVLAGTPVRAEAAAPPAGPGPAAEVLTLPQAIARALAAHPDMLAATVEARNAALGVEDARSKQLQLVAELASLGRHAQSGILDPAGTPAATDIATANTNLELRVPVFTGFKLTNGIRAAEHEQRAADLGQRQGVAQLRFEVTRAYYNVLRQERHEADGQAAIAVAEQAPALARARLKQGTATPLDVERAEVDVLTAKGDQLALGSQTRDARARLASLLGLGPDAVAVVEPAAAPEPQGGAGPTPAAAHARVAAGEAKLDAARASQAAAEGDRWPQVGLVSAYQHGNNPFNPNSGVRGVNATLSGTFDVRLALSYNVFDMGQVGRQIERAENQRKLAEADLDRTRREVATQQALADAKLATARERTQVAEAAAVLAERALAHARTRWAQGYAPQVEVLDAARALTRARAQRVDATYDLAIARAERALARGE